MIDYYEYSIPELVKLLGARFKDYRLRSNMTQKRYLNNRVLQSQPFISLRMVHLAMSRLAHFFCC